MIAETNLLIASVIRSFGGVLLAILILLAMVTIHEFGHYVAGKILGFKINEFSVGFGPAIFKKRSKKTGELFALRIIPLGGYCAFDGEDEGEEPEQPKQDEDEPFAELSIAEHSGEAKVEKAVSQPKNEKTIGTCTNLNVQTYKITEKGGARFTAESLTAKAISSVFVCANMSKKGDAVKEETEKQISSKNTLQEASMASTPQTEYPEPKGVRFNDQAPWKRIIVLLAGATMNYLLALFLILIMFTTIGRPVYRVQVEYPEAPSTATTAVETETDLQNAYLQTGDIILEIDGKDVYLVTDYIDILNNRKQGDEIPVTVMRNEQEMQVILVLKADTAFVNMSDTNALLTSMGIYSLSTVTEQQGFFSSIGHSFTYSLKIGSTVLRSLGELLTGKMGLESMGGPVTTIKVTSEAASSSLLSFLNIAAFIGVNLAVFNLLPIPALDGSKVIFCIIEWIRRKPVNRNVEAMIHFIGIIFLFGFAIFVDLLQLWV